MLDQHRPEPSANIVPTPTPAHATHFPKRTIAKGLADLMSATPSTRTYRIQHIEGHAFRVGVFRQSVYLQVIPDSYLRIETA